MALQEDKQFLKGFVLHNGPIQGVLCWLRQAKRI